MSFEPSGKPATLIAAMRAATHKTVWSAAEAAEVMGIARGNLQAYLRASMENGLLYRKLEDGRSFYSLLPFEPSTPAKLLIPTIKKPGDWVPPVMTPPRGHTGHVARAPLPEPLHQVIAAPTPAPLPAAAPIVTAEPEVEQEQPEAAAVPEFEAALWHDGDLVLYGGEELVDGGYRVPAKNVDSLRWMLGGRAP